MALTINAPELTPVTTLNSEIERTQERISEARGAVIKCEDELAELRRRIATYEAYIAECRAAIASLKGQE